MTLPSSSKHANWNGCSGWMLNAPFTMTVIAAIAMRPMNIVGGRELRFIARSSTLVLLVAYFSPLIVMLIACELLAPQTTLVPHTTLKPLLVLVPHTTELPHTTD